MHDTLGALSSQGRSTVKQAIGKFNISPSLDFDTQHNFEISQPKSDQAIQTPSVKIDPDYNPFETRKETNTGGGYSASFPKQEKPVPSNWDELYKTQDFNFASSDDTQQKIKQNF